MNRRGFLAALIGGLALDPERALWIPGRKLISIPKPRNRYKLGDTILVRKPTRFYTTHPPEYIPITLANVRLMAEYRAYIIS